MKIKYYLFSYGIVFNPKETHSLIVFFSQNCPQGQKLPARQVGLRPCGYSRVLYKKVIKIWRIQKLSKVASMQKNEAC